MVMRGGLAAAAFRVDRDDRIRGGRSSASPLSPARSYEDTPTVPCWLAQYRGETYYMGIQTDVSAEFNPRRWVTSVLVEGTITDRTICGAEVIEPIQISIMPELAPECGEMRVAREGVDLGFEPPRPPGLRAADAWPSSIPEPRAAPKPPFEKKRSRHCL